MEKIVKVVFFGFMIGIWAANAPSPTAGAIGAVLLAGICAIALALGDIT